MLPCGQVVGNMFESPPSANMLPTAPEKKKKSILITCVLPRNNQHLIHILPHHRTTCNLFNEITLQVNGTRYQDFHTLNYNNNI